VDVPIDQSRQDRAGRSVDHGCGGGFWSRLDLSRWPNGDNPIPVNQDRHVALRRLPTPIDHTSAA
jgi:hypothetical protein